MILVALEGPDASGKDTMQSAVGTALRQQGIPVHEFRTPGSGSQTLREEALSGEYKGYARRVLMAADVAVFCRYHLAPAMRSHGRGVVLVNRFWYSDAIYSAAECLADKRARGISPLPGYEQISLSELVYREYGLDTPDLVLRMAPTFDVCYSRLMAKRRDGLEKTYDRRYLRDVYLAYETFDYDPAPVIVSSEVSTVTVRMAVSRINYLLESE